jgi:hypothetical protein
MIQDGFCIQGIRSNAKWSTLNAEIPKGVATGNLEVRPECHVLTIEHDKAGKVTRVRVRRQARQVGIIRDR